MNPNVMDYNNFLKATAYIQEYTRNQINQGIFRNPNVGDVTFQELSTLMASIRDFMTQQRTINDKVEKFIKSQQAINEFVIEKITKCRCKCDCEASSMVPPALLNVNFEEKQGGEKPTLYSLAIQSSQNSFIPIQSTSTSIAEAEPTSSQLELELMKMANNMDPSTSVENKFSDFSNGERHGLMGIDKCNISFDNHFNDPSLLEDKKWDVRKLHKCDECDKVFRQKHGLQQHMQAHHNMGAFFCEHCGKRYTRPESVKRHKKTSQCRPTLLL